MSGAILKMEQLLAFIDVENARNPAPEGRIHIVQWAANEIERLHHLLNRVCVWTISPTDNKTLVGACGAEFKFVNDMPEDGDVSYCIHCGGRVKIPAPGDCPF